MKEMPAGQLKAQCVAVMDEVQVTKDEIDKMVFKVPSLRNIKKTGPFP